MRVITKLPRAMTVCLSAFLRRLLLPWPRHDTHTHTHTELPFSMGTGCNVMTEMKQRRLPFNITIIIITPNFSLH